MSDIKELLRKYLKKKTAGPLYKTEVRGYPAVYERSPEEQARIRELQAQRKARKEERKRRKKEAIPKKKERRKKYEKKEEEKESMRPEYEDEKAFNKALKVINTKIKYHERLRDRQGARETTKMKQQGFIDVLRDRERNLISDRVQYLKRVV